MGLYDCAKHRLPQPSLHHLGVDDLRLNHGFKPARAEPARDVVERRRRSYRPMLAQRSDEPTADAELDNTEEAEPPAIALTDEKGVEVETSQW